MTPTLDIPAPPVGETRQRGIGQAVGLSLLVLTLGLLLFETALSPGFLLVAYTRSKFPNLDASRASSEARAVSESEQTDATRELHPPVQAEDVGSAPSDQSIKLRIRELAQEADALFEGALATSDEAQIWRVIRTYRGPDSSDFASYQRELALAVTRVQPATNASDVSPPRSRGSEGVQTLRETDRQLDHIESLIRESRHRHGARAP